MEVQFAPNSVDVPNLLYKLQRKIKVFNADSLPNRGYNLVATASKFGIVFIASPEGTLSVYYIKELIDKECDSPAHLSLPLQEKPTHISISCDQELLAVTGGRLLCIYNIIYFQNEDVAPVASFSCDVQSTFVSSLQWNPCMPEVIAIAYLDGTLLTAAVTSNQIKKIQSKARCVCWSPRGKQLVVGNSDGTLCQYKPDLSPMKMVAAPKLFEGAPVEAIAIHWISTYQFAVVYRNASDSSRPSLTIVSSPKAGQSSCYNYEDICYSIGSNRPWYYYLLGLTQWNIILASSSNSMEIATLGSLDSVNWFQWCQTDEARPELPLTDKKQDNYPVGVCIDTSSIHHLPWGENETLPSMPMLLVVSHLGWLTIFNMIHLSKDAPQICAVPINMVLPASRLTSTIPGKVESKPVPIKVPAPPQPTVPVTPQVPLESFTVHNQSMTSSTPKPTSVPSSQAQAPKIPDVSVQIDLKPQPPKAQISTEQPSLPKQEPTTQSPQVTQPTKQNVAPPKEIDMNKVKEDQQRAEMQANLELTNMLIKEVNDFQMELYKFVKKTQNVHVQVFHDLNSIQVNPDPVLRTMDTEHLKQECSLEELRSAIIQLKLDLVRACAVVAEARTHSEAKDSFHQWSLPDPLSTKRLSSIKKLSYYIQSQLEQAQSSLNEKWSEISREFQYNDKSIPRMIRPVLDDVYRPLVKQQEILSRQQAMLRILRNTLSQCDTLPTWKPNTLLRSTPFKKDPLSKLTKNILNMSIEPQHNKKPIPGLTAPKLEALRDMLANHKTVRIKPVNIELREQFAAMRLKHEQSLKKKIAEDLLRSAAKLAKEDVISAVEVKPTEPVKPEEMAENKPAVKQETVSVPSTAVQYKSSIPGLANVARTLFTEDPETKPSPITVQKPLFGTGTPTTMAPASATTRDVLKDLLQNKTSSVEPNNENNAFMGQKICSPTPPSVSTPNIPTKPFSVKSFLPATNSTPASDANENKFPVNTKPKVKSQSAETGEAEILPKDPKQSELNIPIPRVFFGKNIFEPNVPDVLQTTATILLPIKKIDAKRNVELKPSEKKSEIDLKENVVGKPTAVKIKETNKNVDSSLKPLQNNQTGPTVPKTTVSVKIESTEKDLGKPAVVSSPSASTIFAAANAATVVSRTKPSQSIFASPASPGSPTGSIFGSSTSPTSLSTGSIFGSTSPTKTSVFGMTATTTTTAVTTTSSVFGSTTATTQATPILFGTSPSQTNQNQVLDSSNTTVTQPLTTSSSYSITTSVFASLSTTSSVFGTASSTTTQPSVFSTPTPASIPASIFDPTTVTAQTSVVGTPTSPSAQTSVFGSAIASSQPNTPTPSTQVPVFTTPTATVQPPAFGTPATATQGSVFGAATSPTQASVFGAATPTTRSSVFGSATTMASVFGPLSATTQPSVLSTSSVTTQSSVFGAPTIATQSSVFGMTPATTQASVFGAPAPTVTTAASIFGTPAVAGQASVFGTPAPAATIQPSVFGTPAPAATTQSSIFGTPTTLTQSSIFGTPAATSAQSSPFGTAESSLFAAASISPTSPQTNVGNVFGGNNASAGSIFGGGNAFGSKPAFGQATSAASIFGGGTNFGQQKQANNFWGGGTNTNTGSTFGASSFGQPTSASSIFGGGGGFSSTATPGPFSSPTNQSAFGSPQQQSGPAFGASPAFGTKPVFGQPTGFSGSGGGFGSFSSFNKSPSGGFGGPAAFGGQPAFGSTATFGNTSPGKMFGSSPPGFGSPTQSNATFENLAGQNTLTFGNLAQQSGQPPQKPAFNTSPSFTGWRG